jgi:hypothetical protein
MKTKLGTSLALAAVLATGTAAAAINTQALNSPTVSKLGSVSNALLPAGQTVAVTPGQNQSVSTTPTVPSVSSSNQNKTTSAPAPQQSASSTPADSISVPTQPATPLSGPTSPTMSVTTLPSPPSVKYGNPNPATGGDDEDKVAIGVMYPCVSRSTGSTLVLDI